MVSDGDCSTTLSSDVVNIAIIECTSSSARQAPALSLMMSNQLRI